MRLKISARKSDLARLQAYMVGEALKKAHPSLQLEFRFKESLGDKNLTDPLWKIPEKGLFTEDFYGELIREETDLVVHSWKDLPTEQKPDTVIAATLPRADQRDLFLFKASQEQQVRESGALRVYSSSPRREYNLSPFLKTHLPFPLEKVEFQSVRGNIPTRVRKLLEDPQVDALIVAKAALDRLLVAEQAEFKEVRELLRSYLQQVKWMVLPLSINPNAAAQGALAIEVKSTRQDILRLLEPIHSAETALCAQKERDILASHGGGCHQKIGVAVLHRPYGVVTLLNGLTDQGVILQQRSLQSSAAAPRFSSDKMWSEEVQGERVPLTPSAPLSSLHQALYVAKASAWPAHLKFSGVLWAAGLTTWKKLAEAGQWVHGCAESLGEHEDPRVDIL
ncbi:MAG: hydroxymethylbilane synthase, partial [Bdellovibrio sp.]